MLSSMILVSVISEYTKRNGKTKADSNGDAEGISSTCCVYVAYMFGFSGSNLLPNYVFQITVSLPVSLQKPSYWLLLFSLSPVPTSWCLARDMLTSMNIQYFLLWFIFFQSCRIKNWMFPIPCISFSLRTASCALEKNTWYWNFLGTLVYPLALYPLCGGVWFKVLKFVCFRNYQLHTLW